MCTKCFSGLIFIRYTLDRILENWELRAVQEENSSCRSTENCHKTSNQVIWYGIKIWELTLLEKRKLYLSNIHSSTKSIQLNHVFFKVHFQNVIMTHILNWLLQKIFFHKAGIRFFICKAPYLRVKRLFRYIKFWLSGLSKIMCIIPQVQRR